MAWKGSFSCHHSFLKLILASSGIIEKMHVIMVTNEPLTSPQNMDNQPSLDPIIISLFTNTTKTEYRKPLYMPIGAYI